MKVIVGILIGCMLSFSANAQVYDLIRTIKNGGNDLTFDSAIHAYFVSTGTMEIADNNLTRAFHTCEFDVCKDFTMIDKILIVDPKGFMAAISGDSGDLLTVTILSLSPTIIILTEDNQLKTYRIDEYKIRQ